MQKIYSACLLFMACAASIQAETNKLGLAVEHQDLEKVKKRLAQVKELDDTDKKLLLKDALKIVGEAREKVSLSKSPWDLAKLVGGSVVALAGTSLAVLGAVGGYFMLRGSGRFDHYFTILSQNDRTRCGMYVLGASAASALLACGGGYVAVKGYSCDTAYGRVTIAKKIADLIKNAPVKPELKVNVPLKSGLESSGEVVP